MIQQKFAENAARILKDDPSVIGLAVAGSWLTNEIDAYSDLDLVLVTSQKISTDKNTMLAYAGRLGKLLTAFTGEHVGEPRLLICLFDEPLLHVDIKFVTLEEFHVRVETPAVILDKEGRLTNALAQSEATFPYPDYQWIEDRFWVWIHYALLKIGRGEYLEALDFFGFVRMVVLGPLLHIKNKNLPRGVRKVETQLAAEDFEHLRSTIPEYDKASLIKSLENTIALYKALRVALFSKSVVLHPETESRVMSYLIEIKSNT